jgi:hypothetical protein
LSAGGSGGSNGFDTTYNGATITAGTDGAAINGHIVSEGARPTTIGGTMYSVNSNGQVVAGSSATFGGSSGFAGTTTLNGEVISALSNGVAVDGHTINDGASATTIDGRMYSVDSNGDLIVASSTTLGRSHDPQVSGLMGALMSVAAAEDAKTTDRSSSADSTNPVDPGSSESGGQGPSDPVAGTSNAGSTTTLSRLLLAGAAMVFVVYRM